MPPKRPRAPRRPYAGSAHRGPDRSRQPARPRLPADGGELAIEALSHELRGIGRVAGKTVFVDNALPGERVRLRYTASRARFDEASAQEILEPSADRRAPPCPHFGRCGGCALQYMEAGAQIAAKQQILLDQLQRLGGIEPEAVLPPLVAATYGYRRKARLGVRQDKSRGLVLGFREPGSNTLTPIEECPVLPAALSSRLPQLRAVIANCQARRQITHLEIAAGDDATALVIRQLSTPCEEDRQRWIDFATGCGYQLYLQAGEASRAERIWPAPGAEERDQRLSYALPAFDLNLAFHPQDFIQVNFDINRQMVSLAVELLAPTAQERVLDLFCGLGNFTLPLARRAGEVVGVEGEAGLVARGRENAERNGLANVTFHAADLSQDFTRSPWGRAGFDKVLLDPPRTGALRVVQALARFEARRVVYVSCNPATLARDAAELRQRGYRLARAGVMDMFPQTTHVESIALFERD
jgi:23S rRNA (uracil1939-C5)-methyltransferase